VRATGRKLELRSQIFKSKFLGPAVYLSAIGFIKIRIPIEEMTKMQTIDILD
jgi:hypothetical protein